MSFLSRDDTIFRDLIDKLTLKRDVRERIAVPSMIMPVVSIDNIVLANEMVRTQITVPEAGALVMMAVPDGERWHIRGARAALYNGTYTFGDLYLVARASKGYQTLKKETASTDVDTGVLPQHIILNSGGTVNITVDGFTTEGDMYLDLTYDVEKIAYP